MDEFNKLTLECFVNKQMYKKYLAKHDPGLFQENQTFYEKLKIYHSQIESITEHMIQYPDSDTYNRTLRESFESYMKSILYHIEVESRNNISDGIYEEEREKDNEMLIDVPPEITSHPENIITSLEQNPYNPIEYWDRYNVRKRN